MRVLIVGSGGREHALAWKLAQTSNVNALFCAPGNGGISTIAQCFDVEPTDTEGLITLVKRERIDFVVVGPENALAGGIVNACEEAGVRVFGPSREGSQIETSKVFAKKLMRKHGIPTAPFQVFDDFRTAHDYIERLIPPYVVKADGLCAGKGAFVINDAGEGEATLHELMVEKTHGEAGRRIVVESFLHGVEASYLAFADGSHILPMIAAQDHKNLLDGDKGPNTGGMGAYAPIPFISGEVAESIDHEVMEKMVEGLREEGILYKGVLYAGLMMDGNSPSVLEFNARFGDPETQPMLFKMESDLLPVMLACCEGNLKNIPEISWKEGISLCVVVASRGYPGKPDKGKLIRGLEDLRDQKDVVVFHAGTTKIGNQYYTSGGRVLGVTAMGETYQAAISKAYEAVSCIKFDGMYYRTDIGWKAVQTGRSS